MSTVEAAVPKSVSSVGHPSGAPGVTKITIGSTTGAGPRTNAPPSIPRRKRSEEVEEEAEHEGICIYLSVSCHVLMVETVPAALLNATPEEIATAAVSFKAAYTACCEQVQVAPSSELMRSLQVRCGLV